MQPNAGYQGSGVAASGTVGPLACAYSASYQPKAGDLNFLVFETTGTSTVTTPTGFQLVPGLPIQTGSTAADTKLYVFWRRLEADGEAAPTITGFSDHGIVRQFSYRYAYRRGDPFVDIQTAVKTVASLQTDWPLVTTVDPSTTIIFIASHPGPGADTWDDPNLTVNGVVQPSFTIFENWTTSGDDGGIIAGRYVKTAAGLSTQISCPRLVSGTDVTVTIALRSDETVGQQGRLYVPGKSPLRFSRTFKTPRKQEVIPPVWLTLDQTLPKLTQAISSTERMTATVSSTLPKLGQAVAATERISGSIAATMPKIAQAVASKEVFSATVTQTLPKITAALSAKERFNATITATLPKITAAIAASEIIRATVAQTLPKLAQSVTATEKANATVAQTLPKIGQALSATYGRQIATISATLPKITASLTAQEKFSAAIAQVLPKIGQAVTTKELLSASVASVLPKIGQSITAAQVQMFSATVVQTMPALLQALGSKLVTSGTIAQILPSLRQDARNADDPTPQAVVKARLGTLAIGQLMGFG